HGCARGPAAVATLGARTGVAERSRDGLASWHAAAVGESFVLGDAVRTGVASTARVQLVVGGGLSLGPQSVVRFMGRPGVGAAPRLRVESGEVEIESTPEELVFETDVGTARVSRSSRLHVHAAGGHDVSFEITVGHVELERDGGAPVVASAGDRLVLTVE